MKLNFDWFRSLTIWWTTLKILLLIVLSFKVKKIIQFILTIYRPIIKKLYANNLRFRILSFPLLIQKKMFLISLLNFEFFYLIFCHYNFILILLQVKNNLINFKWRLIHFFDCFTKLEGTMAPIFFPMLFDISVVKNFPNFQIFRANLQFCVVQFVPVYTQFNILQFLCVLRKNKCKFLIFLYHFV